MTCFLCEGVLEWRFFGITADITMLRMLYQLIFVLSDHPSD